MVGPSGRNQVELAVLLIDEPPPGQSLARTLSAAGVNIVGVYGYGRHIAATVRSHDCDVILVGLRHPLSRALRAVEYASLASEDAPIVAFVDEDVPGLLHLARQAMQAGARDIVTTPIDRQELDLAMRQAILIEERRRLARGGSLDDIQPQGEVCVVFGARGGVGASTFAVNLSFAHAALSDERVVLLDTTSGVAGIDGLVTPSLLAPIPAEALEAIEGVVRDSLYELEPLGYQGLAIVRGGGALGAGKAQAGAEPPIVSLAGTLARVYDYVYVDTQSPWSDQNLAAFEVASTVILLITPEFSTVASTKMVLDTVSSVPLLRDKIMLVLNHASLPGGMSQGEIEKALNFPIAWEVEDDSQANIASQLGRPLVEVFPETRAAKSMLGLLYALTGIRAPSSEGKWQQLIDRLPFGKRRRAMAPMVPGSR